MKEIALSQGYVALVDDADYELLTQFHWRIQKTRQFRYARTNVRKADGTQTTQTMHRFLLGLNDPAIRADHINGNGLDNRRENLRAASAAQNSQNRRLPKSNTSGFKGVFKYFNKWRVYLRSSGQHIWGGNYATAREAAHAYNELALKHHGASLLTLIRFLPSILPRQSRHYSNNYRHN
jgi:hypothetical protein